jgi:beta-phosphoglucomutase-like phosphatase (HAD superfamily)
LQRLPKNYSERVDAKARVAYHADLRAVKGVPELLRQVAVPSCVASSNHPEWLDLKLSITGLKPFFGNAIFIGHQVKRGKTSMPNVQGWALPNFQGFAG